MDHRHLTREEAMGERHQHVHKKLDGLIAMPPVHKHKVPEDGEHVWITAEGQSRGRTGKRSLNNPVAIAQTIMEIRTSKTTRVLVHSEKCNDGRTTTDPCDCYPMEVL